MSHQPQPVVKALILCKGIQDTPGEPGLFDLKGAGLSALQATSQPPFPFRHTVWVYFQLTDHRPQGRVRLAVMRADSGRRVFTAEHLLHHPDRLLPTSAKGYLPDFVFPDRGVYMIELWYNDECLVDQRLEVRG
jgi:hypothetical protein